MRLEALVAETASNPSSEPREQPLLVYQTGRAIFRANQLRRRHQLTETLHVSSSLHVDTPPCWCAW